MKRQYFIPVVLFCGLFSSCKDEEVAEKTLRPVVTQTVKAASKEETRTFSGIVKASGAATLSFEVPGRITRLIANEGVFYKKGDLLAQLDVANLESDLRSAQAQQLQANEELKRVQQLFESGNASRAQLDSAIAAQRSATAALEVSQENLSDGTLTMPYDGTIETVIADEQSVVGAGAEVMTIQGDEAMKVEIGVPAETVSQVTIGMPGIARIGKLTSNTPLYAEVDRIFPQAQQNGTYIVSLVLKDAGDDIRGGMDAEVDIAFANPNGETLRVDAAAVASLADSGTFLWVLKDSIVHKRQVEVGELRESGQIEILSGLEAGETIITRGVHQVSEGQKVKTES